MTDSAQDIWSDWLLNRRFGGDQQAMQNALQNYLYPWRDQILQHAALHEGDLLLDVGCGDGLVAFGALQKTATGRVIFSDISQDLLDYSRELSREMGLLDRCQFERASADDLSVIDDASVDIVTTRSVLIYVAEKRRAFQEFHRVLKPEGCLSIFEPINRYREPEPDHLFGGYDVTPVGHLAKKIRGVYEELQPLDSDPMVDFDERDLVIFAEEAGFSEVNLELRREVKKGAEKRKWDTLVNMAPNPKVPPTAEVMQQVLTPAEIDEFSAHLRPLVEQGLGTQRSAVAFLWAIK